MSEFLLDPALIQGDDGPECPKCGERSGNDWSQCRSACPIQAPPYFTPRVAALAAEIRAKPPPSRDEALKQHRAWADEGKA